MQQNPVQRMLRFIILSMGFVLFVMLAFHSAKQVSDPQFTKGKPFFFSRPQTTASTLGVRQVPDIPEYKEAADTVATSPVNTSPAAAAKSSLAGNPRTSLGSKPQAVTASEHTPLGQAQKAIQASGSTKSKN